MSDDIFPDARWGNAEAKLPDWRGKPDDDADDDAELPATPPDVVAMLGFDPLEKEEAEPEVEK